MARYERQAMMEPADRPDIRLKALAKEPTDKTEAKEPTLPMLNAEPILPMLRIELREPMLSMLLREPMLHLLSVLMGSSEGLLSVTSGE